MFAIGRYRVAEVRTNRSHLARRSPAPPLLLDHRLAPAALAQAVLDPLVAIGALLLSAFAFGAAFRVPT